ncbi:MAG: nicotinamide mononucleotide transporter [Bacteroidales bacterium]|nr:nicotinamide mononucleotide transporter [Bacteroidales bacterium]MBR5861918.1 nicotinamide mononucleotide transporter [Bacteroidales bacterium]
MMNNRVLSLYDWFLIVGVIASNVIYTLLTGNLDIVGSVAGIAGVFCVVLVAKGSIWNYLFGIINVSMYAYISYKASLYGDAGLNALYYVPMQFIGWWQWRKRGAAVSEAEAAGQGVQVKARRFDWRQRVLLAAGCTAAVVAVGFALRHFGDPQPFKDSLTTVLSIVAQALMALAFMEQWVLWIITNIVSVIMWSVCVARGEAHAAVMVIMWSFYLLNSINGLRVWLKLSKEGSDL